MLQALSVLVFLSMAVSAPAMAADGSDNKSPNKSPDALNNKAPASEPQTDQENSDDKAIDRCLRVWGNGHPFAGDKARNYLKISTNVQVLGAGGTVEDNSHTSEPRLILVKPSVSVMSKSVMKLMNPNGWYCLKANVTVMAKSIIELACHASIADSVDGVAVLGSNDKGTGQGVTVLGKTELKRVGCESK